MKAISTVVTVHDHPGNGGAHHHYRISEADASGETCGPAGKFARIMFQNGPIGEVGVNGCTNEDLLGVVAHRLACFQAGPFACMENAVALQNVGVALDWLRRRTQARQAQGVEGSNLQHVATGAVIDTQNSEQAFEVLPIESMVTLDGSEAA